MPLIGPLKSICFWVALLLSNVSLQNNDKLTLGPANDGFSLRRSWDVMMQASVKGQIVYLQSDLQAPEYVEKNSYRSLKKPLTRENWDKLSVYFTICEW